MFLALLFLDLQIKAEPALLKHLCDNEKKKESHVSF